MGKSVHNAHLFLADSLKSVGYGIEPYSQNTDDMTKMFKKIEIPTNEMKDLCNN